MEANNRKQKAENINKKIESALHDKEKFEHTDGEKQSQIQKKHPKDYSIREENNAHIELFSSGKIWSPIISKTNEKDNSFQEDAKEILKDDKEVAKPLYRK